MRWRRPHERARTMSNASSRLLGSIGKANEKTRAETAWGLRIQESGGSPFFPTSCRLSLFLLFLPPPPLWFSPSPLSENLKQASQSLPTEKVDENSDYLPTDCQLLLWRSHSPTGVVSVGLQGLVWNVKKTIAVIAAIDATFAAAKKKPKKNQAWTSAKPVQRTNQLS